MAKSDESITTDESKETRISPNYTKDFTSRVKSLQSFFAGKKRRALYDTLLAKGVITQHYSVTKWNNDFKAWKNNPNNGIFRYLEMVSAILDEANIPAFEIFGGPHARDTDEIIKSISSRIENYLDNSLEGFKDYKTKSNRTPQKSERIINGNAFKNMEQVRELILKNRYFLQQYCTNMDNPAFFFLYAWADLEKKLRKPGSEELIDGIEKLAEKIMNTTFAPYYYGYFFEPYDNNQCNDKYFKFVASAFPVPNDFLFDNILNQVLLISYQLTCIVHIFSLYYDHKAVSYTVNYVDAPLSYPLTIIDPYSGKSIPIYSTPMRMISNIKEKVHISLCVGTLNYKGDNKYPKKIFKQKLQEIKDIFLSIVALLTNNEMNADNISYIINHNERQSDSLIDITSYLKYIIDEFLNIMEYLDWSCPEHSKETISLYYTISKKNKEDQKDEMKKMPIQIRKERLSLNFTQEKLDNIDKIIEQLKAISSAITIRDESTNTDYSIAENNNNMPENSNIQELAPYEGIPNEVIEGILEYEQEEISRNQSVIPEQSISSISIDPPNTPIDWGKMSISDKQIIPTVIRHYETSPINSDPTSPKE